MLDRLTKDRDASAELLIDRYEQNKKLGLFGIIGLGVYVLEVGVIILISTFYSINDNVQNALLIVFLITPLLLLSLMAISSEQRANYFAILAYMKLKEKKK